jgi:RHS repeat-associated protein
MEIMFLKTKYRNESSTGYEYREQISYRPFGEVKDRLYCTGSTAADARLKYIGKQMDFEMNLADHGVRKYDNTLGQFTSIDPLWEKYYGWTPYHYCRNNPINRLDPNGKYGPSFSELSWSIMHAESAQKIYINKGTAEEATKKYPGQNNGIGDALRHTYWSALNARDVGYKDAREFGDLHETSNGGEENQNNMDYHNNEKCFEIGWHNPNLSDAEIWELVKFYWNSGSLQLEPTADLPKRYTPSEETKKHENDGIIAPGPIKG